MLQTPEKIEALLFYKGEPMSMREIATVLELPLEEIKEALAALEQSLERRGVRLITLNDVYELRTAPDAATVLEKLQAKELSNSIGKAGTETLSIILYNNPISRAEIDYIRGVNSTFILRNLAMRGLIERTPNPTDQRSYVYTPTHELLAHLGITKIEELPEYEKIQNELRNFKLNDDETA